MFICACVCVCVSVYAHSFLTFPSTSCVHTHALSCMHSINTHSYPLCMVLSRTNASFPAGGFGPATGYPQGFPGSMLPPIKNASVWVAGSQSQVSWVSVANERGAVSPIFFRIVLQNSTIVKLYCRIPQYYFVL